MPESLQPPRVGRGMPDWEREGADWPNRAASRFWRVGAFVWHFQRSGVGPTILMLHGTGASTHSWAPMIARLSPNFEMISIDLPGHGFTRTPPHFRPTLNNMCDAVSGLLADMKVEPDIIMGHSAGVAIAIRLVAKRHFHPRLIVSINGALEPFGGIMKTLAPITAKAASLGGIAAKLVANNVKNGTRIRNLIQTTGSDPDALSTEHYAALFAKRGHVQGALRMMAHWDLSQILPDCQKMDVPIAYITGARDKAVAPQISKSAAGQTPLGTYVELAGLGHLAHEEDPEAVAQSVQNAWQRAPKSEQAQRHP